MAVPEKKRSAAKPAAAPHDIWMAPISEAPVPAICGTGSIAAAIALVLALFGIPLFMAGAIILGAVLAIPLIVLAVLSIPIVAVLGVLGLVVVLALVVAIKIAIWVVLPIVIVGLVVGWFVRANRRQQGLEV